jgi:hypothetical protein
MNGAPSVARKNSGLSLLITEDMKNTQQVYHCLTHQENQCAKSVKMINVITVAAKPVNYIGSKEVKRCQFNQF